MNDEVVEAVVKALAVAEEHAGAVAQDKPPHGEATDGSCICCCVVCESAVQAVARAALGAEPVARMKEALRFIADFDGAIDLHQHHHVGPGAFDCCRERARAALEPFAGTTEGSGTP